MLTSEYDGASISHRRWMRRDLTVDADEVEQRNEVNICVRLSGCETGACGVRGRTSVSCVALGRPSCIYMSIGGVPLSFSSFINQSNN